VDREVEAALHELPEMMARHTKRRGSKASTRDMHQNPTRYAQTRRRVLLNDLRVKDQRVRQQIDRDLRDPDLIRLGLQARQLQRQLDRATGSKAGQLQMQLDKAKFLWSQRAEAGDHDKVKALDRQIALLHQQLAAADGPDEDAIKAQLAHAKALRGEMINRVIWRQEREMPEMMAGRRKRQKPRASQADVDAARARTVHGERRGGSGAGTGDVHTAPARYRQIRQGVERRAQQQRQAAARKARDAAALDPRVIALEEQIAELERQHRHALKSDASRAAHLSEDLRGARTTLKQLKAQLSGQTQESELWELFA
jgi:hypothetical protein